MFKIILRITVALSLGGSSTAMAELMTQEITYSVGDTEMIGFLAWDDAIEGKRPGVLVVHEWWGQNDYPRRRAQMLAELGYTAMALDMYGDGKSADHPEGAGAFMRESLSNLPQARERFIAALDLLRAQPTVDPENIAAIGYCYGGGVVLHMARYGADLKAVASFHGSPGLGVAPEGEGGEVTARIAVYNGEDDSMVSADQLAGLAAELEAAGADFQIINFPGAVHGFTNPEADRKAEQYGMPLGYNALADESSWDHMQLVLANAFSD